MTSPRPQPFPFAALPAVSREEIEATLRLRETASTVVRTDMVAEAMGDLVGEPTSIVLRRARSMDAASIPADAIGVAIARTDHRGDLGMSRAILVDVEPVLAIALVTRALRQRAPQVSDPSRAPVSPEVAGALAALLHTTLRRAHSDVAMRVVAAGPAQALARDLASANRSVVTAWLTVILGGEAFDARVSVGLDDLTPRGATHLSSEALRRMNDAPIALPLVAHTCLLHRAELLSLRAGDALLLPGLPLRGDGDAVIGPVAIVAASSERGLSGDLAEGGRLVLRTERIESHPWDRRADLALAERDKDMTDKSAEVTLEVLEDAPIVVRVELGAVEMKAREWASLSTGDVVALGRKLGDPAILRVGGVEVGRGELVQVDGEYGVRILAASSGAAKR